MKGWLCVSAAAPQIHVPRRAHAFAEPRVPPSHADLPEAAAESAGAEDVEPSARPVFASPFLKEAAETQGRLEPAGRL